MSHPITIYSMVHKLVRALMLKREREHLARYLQKIIIVIDQEERYIEHNSQRYEVD